jgi:hypothetical protein
MKKYVRFTLIVMFLTSAFFVSCSKDEEATPEYVGTWENSYSDYGEYSEDSAEMKTILELSSGAFSMIEKEKVGDVFVEVYGIKGSLSVSGNKMTSTINQYGEDENMEDTNYELTWYKKGSTEFTVMQAFLEAFGGSLTTEATYVLNGDKLTVTADGETIVYTKL